VRTQLPYALLVGIVAIAVCSIPVAYGMPWWLGLLAGAALLYLVLRIAGNTTPSAP
jgi:Na+/H+ antiporter NhaC